MRFKCLHTLAPCLHAASSLLRYQCNTPETPPPNTRILPCLWSPAMAFCDCTSVGSCTYINRCALHFFQMPVGLCRAQIKPHTFLTETILSCRGICIRLLPACSRTWLSSVGQWLRVLSFCWQGASTARLVHHQETSKAALDMSSPCSPQTFLLSYPWSPWHPRHLRCR